MQKIHHKTLNVTYQSDHSYDSVLQLSSQDTKRPFYIQLFERIFEKLKIIETCLLLVK